MLTDLIPAYDIPCPAQFRSAGKVIRAHYTVPPAMLNRRGKKMSESQRRGKKYEEKVLNELAVQFGAGLVASPWIEFYPVRGSQRYCQPDAVLIEEEKNLVTIFEIKLAHTIDAYWQLNDLYSPVLSALAPGMDIRIVEITRSFDPVIRFPRPIRLTFSFETFKEMPVDTQIVEVLQWR